MTDTEKLTQLLVMQAETKGELNAISRQIDQGNKATDARISELSKSVDQRFNGLEASVGQRFNGLEARVERLEEGEKKMLWRLGGVSAAGGLISAAIMATLKNFTH